MNKMTKQDWLDVMVQEEIPIYVYWNYFDDMRPGKVSYADFERQFPTWAYRAIFQAVLNSEKKPKIFKMDVSLHKMFDHFNKKFADG